MNKTDNTLHWYGNGPKIPDRARKKLYIEKLSCLDGEDATMNLTIGTMKEREEWVDSLPDEVIRWSIS